jgi:putative OPT family oligopeptide transporter
MLLGGLWALWSMRRSLVTGVRSGLQEFSHARRGAPRAETDRDMPMPLVLGAIVLFVLPIFWLYWQVVDTIGISLLLAGIMVVSGFLFSSVAAYMAGLVGSSNNPISGITIATITFASFLLLLLLGADASQGPAAAIMVGAVVCCAAAIAGDNLQDLKAGYILGATPWKQQVMQGVGVFSAALVIAPILTLLLVAYGFGPATADQPNALAAPQATLMASVARGVFGGALPWDMIIVGLLTGATVIAADEVLRRRGATFRMPVLAVAVGIYLPLQLTVPIFLGGLIAWASERAAGHEGAGRQAGVLIAAGLITGEALVGILLALPIVMTGDPGVLSVANWSPLVAYPAGVWPGLAAMVALAGWLYTRARVRVAA